MPNNKPESRLIKAAGAVAWRPGPDGEPEILLVHRKRYDDWSLPKGKVEPGEPLPVTAAREVLEEGGARLALGRHLISVRYNVGGRPKRVHYWSARVTSMDDHAVPNSEVDLIAWVPASHAVGRVSYAHDHGVLADFARLPARTVPLILLRHAKAMSKSGWKRGDASRPLDDSGRADAKSLADLLACFAPRAGFDPRPRLISSPAVRCTDTLRPFAELSGAQLREEPSLYIHNKSSGTGRADSGPSMADLVREAIAAGEPTVLCAHRENIPDLQAAALAALGVEPAPGGDGPISRQTRKEWDTPLPTGGFWVLNLELAPTPTPPPPALPSPAASPAAAPSPGQAPAAAASTASALRRWLRGRAGASKDAADSGEAGSVVSNGVPEPGPGPEPPDAPRPTALLISADRYDLSDA
jgi:8-oxo-dGTP pyrophosphatase MutT (NUDIX family)/phosphohistidine phosphatase SixA